MSKRARNGKTALESGCGLCRSAWARADEEFPAAATHDKTVLLWRPAAGRPCRNVRAWRRPVAQRGGRYARQNRFICSGRRWPAVPERAGVEEERPPSGRPLRTTKTGSFVAAGRWPPCWNGGAEEDRRPAGGRYARQARFLAAVGVTLSCQP